MGKLWSSKELRVLEEMYPCAPRFRIEDALGRSWGSISGTAKARGIHRNAPQSARSLRTQININFFKRWSDDMGYVLGFWFADGHMTHGTRGQYSIGFCSKDYEHLEAIRNALGSAHRIYDKHDGSYRLIITNKTLWGDMKALGCIPAKSLIVTYPRVPSIFLASFLRGYVDGDGSVGFYTNRQVPSLRIVGTSSFLEGLASQIYEETGVATSKVYIHERRVAFIRYTGLKAKCLASWLYEDSSLHLERKYLIAMRFLDWIPSRFGFKQRVITPKMLDLFPSLVQRGDGYAYAAPATR